MGLFSNKPKFRVFCGDVCLLFCWGDVPRSNLSWGNDVFARRQDMIDRCWWIKFLLLIGLIGFRFYTPTFPPTICEKWVFLSPIGVTISNKLSIFPLNHEMREKSVQMEPQEFWTWPWWKKNMWNIRRCFSPTWKWNVQRDEGLWPFKDQFLKLRFLDLYIIINAHSIHGTGILYMNGWFLWFSCR